MTASQTVQHTDNDKNVFMCGRTNIETLPALSDIGYWQQMMAILRLVSRLRVC